MSEISQRHAGLAAKFTDTVKAVPDNQWSSPSPCEGWTVGADEQTELLAFLGRQSSD